MNKNFYIKRYGASLGLYMAKWRKKNRKRDSPWGRFLNNAWTRCNVNTVNKYEYYGGKGIKCFLNGTDIKFLYLRDKAWLLKQASLDRIDSNGHYEKSNCRFIEMAENRRKKTTQSM